MKVKSQVKAGGQLSGIWATGFNQPEPLELLNPESEEPGESGRSRQRNL